MGSCPVGVLSWWGVVQVGTCPGGELSRMGIRPGGSTVGELSWWGVVLVGNEDFQKWTTFDLI